MRSLTGWDKLKSEPHLALCRKSVIFATVKH